MRTGHSVLADTADPPVSLPNNTSHRATLQGMCAGNRQFAYSDQRDTARNDVCKVLGSGCTAWFVQPPTSVALPANTFAMVTAGHCVVDMPPVVNGRITLAPVSQRTYNWAHLNSKAFW